MENKQIKVKILNVTPVDVVVNAARISHGGDYTKYTEQENVALLHKLVKIGHHSPLEHAVISYEIKNVTRALLQELVRHRIASYTVESTRFTLNKAINNYKDPNINLYDYFKIISDDHYKIIKSTWNYIIGLKMANPKLKNDELKYYLPESYYVRRLAMTINLRALFNFFHLRLNKKALPEIQELAQKMLEALPKIYQELYTTYENFMNNKGGKVNENSSNT